MTQPFVPTRCTSRPGTKYRPLGGAVVADAAEDDVVGDGVAGFALDLVQRALELRVGEGLDLAAVCADEMVMVLAVGLDGLVARGRRADVDALDEAVAGQLLERSVDARDPDLPALCAQPVEDLLGGDAAALAAEQLDHGAAGGAVPPAHAVQRLHGRLDPVAHERNDNDYR